MKMTLGGRDGGGEDCFFFVVAAADAVAPAVSSVQDTTNESHLLETFIVSAIACKWPGSHSIAYVEHYMYVHGPE